MEIPDKQWKSIYKLGGVSTTIVRGGIILDLAVGSIRGGDVAAFPQTAINVCQPLKETGF